MKNNSNWKRVAAGALSFALVAGAMPANVGGFLTGGTGIVAYAAALTDTSSTDKQSDSSAYAGYNIYYSNLNAYGKDENGYIQTTYANNGFRFAISISDDGVTYTTPCAISLDRGLGAVYSTPDPYVFVKISAQLTSDGRGVKISYDVENTSNTTKYIKIGSSADTDLAGHDNVDVTPNSNGLTLSSDPYKFNIGLSHIDSLKKWVGNYVTYIYSLSQQNDVTFRDGIEDINGDSAASWHWEYALEPDKTNTTYAYLGTTAEDYVVLFDTTGGSLISSQGVSKDGKATEPEAPSQKDCTFVGWYADPELKTEFDFDSVITADTTVYAKWIKNVNLTIPDSAVIDGQTAENGVYRLQSENTYYIYSNDTLNANLEEGLEIEESVGKNGYTVGGKKYAYKYTVTVTYSVRPGTDYVFSHKHAAKAFSIDSAHPDTDKVWVFCEGESNSEAEMVAWLDTDGTYLYGDVPTVEDVKTQEYYGATSKVVDFFFTKKGDKSGTKVDVSKMETGETYIVNAKVAVTIDNKVSNFAITREIVYAARPLSECDLYYINAEGEETPITDADYNKENDCYELGEIFGYDSNEKELTIIAKNPANNETVVFGKEYATIEKPDDLTEESAKHFADKATDADWYWTGLYAPETVDENVNNYTGDISINWNIAKADAEVDAEPVDNIVYDGQPIDETDFNFTDELNVIGSKDAEITIKDENENLTDAGTHNVSIEISSKNYNDIVIPATVDIAKRKVTITPDEKQSMTYGDDTAPVITYTVETAADKDGDGKFDNKTGFIESDLSEKQTPADFFGDAVKIGTEIKTSNILSPAKDDAFDYEYLMNDAGTYNYTASETLSSASNYELSIAEGSGVFTIEKKPLSSDMFSIDETNYVYNGDIFTAPSYSINEDNFANDTAKISESDFVTGGTSKAVLPGAYTLEFNADEAENSNYTGWISYNWYIQSDKAYTAEVNAESFTYGDINTQDGISTVIFKTDDEEKTPAKINSAKTTYTYYAYDGVSEITDKYVSSLTPLDEVPKNAGNYIVKASTTARGYDFDDSFATFTISKRALNIIPDVTENVFGSELPELTYTVSGAVDGETGDVEGTLKLADDYSGNYGSYGFDISDITCGDNYYIAGVGSEFNISQKELFDENIIVSGDCIMTSNGWAYPNDKIKVVAVVNGIMTELVNGEDYEIVTATRTRNLGDFSVQINGINNYKGFAEAMVTVVSADSLNQYVSITAPSATKNASGVGRVTATFTNSIPANNFTVLESGILYVKDAACMDKLVLDNIGTNGISKKVNTSNAESQTLNVTDPDNKGAVMRGYAVVTDGNATQEVYTDEVRATYLQLAIENAAEAFITDAAPTKNASGTGRVSATMTYEIKNDDFTVSESGILYVKDVNNEDELTLNNIGTNGIGKKVNTSNAESQTLNVTDPDNNGAKLRGYVTVTGGGFSKTFYTDEVKGSYAEMALETAVKLNISSPAATVNASGTGRVSATFTKNATDGFTITESGILYVKDADCEDELTLENVGVNGIGKKMCNNPLGEQTLNVTDTDGQGAKMRGYAIVTNGNFTKTIYTNEISGTYAELSK